MTVFSIIDVETTGYPHNKITDISIYNTNSQKIVAEFHSLVNPDVAISSSITRLTGITNEMVRDAPFFYEIAKEIVNLTRDNVFVAHNVNFDFNVIKNEFKNLGYTFHRKKMCTVKLSRKLLPGHKSYSLGKLCEDLSIPIYGRHRAKGDALATLQLFKLLINKSDQGLFNQQIAKKQLTISQFISESDLAQLSNKTGVYYFWNIENTIIYIGKSVNIKDRVLSHFRNTSKKELKMCQEVARITYEETGNDLIAQLKESAEIKTHYPIYNYRQKRVGENYGLSFYTNNEGVLELSVGYVKLLKNPILTFEKSENAKDFLMKIAHKHELCLKYCGLDNSSNECFNHQLNKCRGVCVDKEAIKNYNIRVLKVISSFEYKNSVDSLFLAGRKSKEKSFVKIENGVYKGYGYYPKLISKEMAIDSKQFLIPQKENGDTKRIISSYLRKNAK
ncbi:MAG: exonuclease domain-containing protein [Flavobacteriales bacterium]|nr:exonuclease domain-containing protein [Flavobacteriales bacterium]